MATEMVPKISKYIDGVMYIRLAIVTSIKHLLNHLAGELPWLYNFLCCTFTESVLIYRLIKGIAYIYVGLYYPLGLQM